jgi:hypothetical protein
MNSSVQVREIRRQSERALVEQTFLSASSLRVWGILAPPSGLEWFGGTRMSLTHHSKQTRMTARQKAEDNGGAAAVHLAFGFLHDCLLG